MQNRPSWLIDLKTTSVRELSAWCVPNVRIQAESLDKNSDIKMEIYAIELNLKFSINGVNGGTVT